MDRNSKIELLTLLEEKQRRVKYRKLNSFYPDEGPLRRELYQKHLKFFAGGKQFRERLFLGANRIGKTEGTGGVEFVFHLTGLYPKWWQGRRFDTPIEAWCAGTKAEATRDIIQKKLMGSRDSLGTGLIPGHLIVGSPTMRKSISDAYDTVRIRHVSGGISVFNFKSFEQGRTSFEGTYKNVIWLDEEPPLDVYTESLLRTADTTGSGKHNGLLMLTFTPLEGMSETVLQFLPGGKVEEREVGSKLVVMAGWDDVPHLDEQTKKELLASIPPYQRDARTKGIPALGAGAIYPVPESDFVVDDFKVPEHWLQFYAQDVGWNRTAVGWFAYDREVDTLYITGEYYRAQAEPSIHATAIRARGEWVPGVIDPAARGRGQKDGEQLLQIYRDLGLDLQVANNAVEAGLLEVWQRLSTGRLKVFRSCQNWLEEKRLYRRDEKGRIVKVNDHLMDLTRYGVMSGIARAKTKPSDKKKQKIEIRSGNNGTGWMG